MEQQRDDLILHRAHEGADGLLTARRRRHAALEKGGRQAQARGDVAEELTGVVDQHLVYQDVADRDQQKAEGEEHAAVGER